MHGNQDNINSWNLHQLSTGSCSPQLHMDPYDEDRRQDEDDMENEEIEAMLYSQLYFEPHDSDETREFAAPTDYNIEIVNQKVHSKESFSLASIVNFSGRSYMSPSEVTLKRKDTAAHPSIKKSKTEPKEKTLTKETCSKMEKCGKKKGVVKEVVLVMSDSSDGCKKEEIIRNKRNSENSQGNSTTKRRADKVKTTTVKKVKKSNKEVIIVESSSDDVLAESDSDNLMFNTWSDSDDDFDIDLNVNGLWQSMRNPVRLKPVDLQKINLQTWDGDPPLTVEEVHHLLQGTCWKINDDDRYGLMRSYGQNRIVCKNCNERGHQSRKCPKPKKESKCAMCGETGHMHWRCPNSLCYNCDLPGHSSKMCSAPRKSHKVICNRCGFSGHIQSTCPELWRQYHLTTKPGPLQESKQKENKAIFCYNCGRKGHYGHECSEEMINEYLQPWCPFITRYSNPDEVKHKKAKYRAQGGKESKNRRKIKYKEQREKASSVPSFKGIGKTWVAKKIEKTSTSSRREKKENNRIKVKQPSVPQFLENSLGKVDLNQKKQNAGRNKKAFDAEVDNFPRNKSSRKNTNKKGDLRTDQYNWDVKNLGKNGRRKAKQLTELLQGGLDKVPGKHETKDHQDGKMTKKNTAKNLHTIFHSPPVSLKKTGKNKTAKSVHSIFDSPPVSWKKTDKNKTDKNDELRNDRQVMMNKRGFKMTIYN